MFTYILVAVAIVGSQNVFAQMGMGMGPVNVQLVDSRSCENHQGYMNIAVVDVGDNKKGFTIDVDLPQPLDETISYAVRMDKVQNGQIQKGVFRHGGKNACVDLDKFLGNLWKKMVIASGAPEGCPTPAGKYHIEKFPLNNEDLEVKSFLYGRFLLHMEMFKDGEKVVCQVIEFTNSRPGESV